MWCLNGCGGGRENFEMAVGYLVLTVDLNLVHARFDSIVARAIT